MNTEALFSSDRNDWETPHEFFKKYDDIYHFNLDVCANENNNKCTRYFTKKEDGLKQKWEGTCWMNPPYGREIYKWMEKAYLSSQEGATVVCLVPSRTDTQWWHDYAIKGDIEFIKGRLKFVGAKHSAPFPNAVVIFKEEQQC